MTNEELAMIAKTDSDTLLFLWDNVRKLLYYIAKRYYTLNSKWCACIGATLDDLKQTSYIAFVYAVKYFDKDKGYKFNSYLYIAFLKALKENYDVCKEQGKKDPLNNYGCIRLENELTEDGSSYSEIIEDIQATEEFINAENKIYCNGLKNDIEQAMSDNLNDDEQAIIREVFYNNTKIKELAEKNKKDYGQLCAEKNKALSKLRKHERIQKYKDDIIQRFAYSNNNFFHSFTSSTEKIILKFEEIEGAKKLNKNL